MRAVIQRVSRASVEVAGGVVGAIDEGLLILVAIVDADTTEDVDAMADKVVHLRIFGDEEGKMNRSLVETGGSVLVISQFTLAGDVRRGRRPSFTGAAQPEFASQMVDELCDAFRDRGIDVATGSFGAMMSVQLVNEGPVTFVVDVVDGRVVSSAR